MKELFIRVITSHLSFSINLAYRWQNPFLAWFVSNVKESFCFYEKSVKGLQILSFLKTLYAYCQVSI